MTFQYYPLQIAIVDLRSIKTMVDLHRKWAEREFYATDITLDKACRAKVLDEVKEISNYVDLILKNAEDRIALDANEKEVHIK